MLDTGECFKLYYPNIRLEKDDISTIMTTLGWNVSFYYKHLKTCLHRQLEKGPFNKHVIVEGEGGGHEIRDKPLGKFRGKGGQGLPVP